MTVTGYAGLMNCSAVVERLEATCVPFNEIETSLWLAEKFPSVGTTV